MLSIINQFLQEVRAELKKVSWPTRQETIKYTAIVIGISGVVALFLGALDFLFTNILQQFI